MATTREGLSERAMRLAHSGKSIQFYTTAQVAKRLSVRSMTLMRWIVNEDIGCPAHHLSNVTGLHRLWNEEEIRRAAEFRNCAFLKITRRHSHPPTNKRIR